MSILDALKLKNFETEIKGVKFTIRRPSAADMILAAETHAKNANEFPSWLVYNHLMDGDKKVFNSVQEVLECDGNTILALADVIDKLYVEGGN